MQHPLPTKSGVFNVLDYGAKGDGTNDDTASIQQAVEPVRQTAAGRWFCPAEKPFSAAQSRCAPELISIWRAAPFCAAKTIEDVVFDNVRVEVGKTTDVPGGFYDDRPIGGVSAGGKFEGIYIPTPLPEFLCEM